METSDTCPKCTDRKLTIETVDDHYRFSLECKTCMGTVSKQTKNLGLFLQILENEING